MRKLFYALALVVLTGLPTAAQESPKVELFGGYSFLRFRPGVGGRSFNGWNAAVTVHANDWLGFTADFSGHYRSESILSILPPPFPSPLRIHLDQNVHSFLFGPHVSRTLGKRWRPFAHALFGVTRDGFRAVATGGPAPFPPLNSSNVGFGMALGGGLDVRISDSVALRVAQTDYLLTRNFGFNSHNFRYSAGVVFRFGKR